MLPLFATRVCVYCGCGVCVYCGCGTWAGCVVLTDATIVCHSCVCVLWVWDLGGDA